MLQKPLLVRFYFVVCRGGTRIFLRRGWTTKKWWRKQILKANMWTAENTWQTIQQILYNCEADCTVLIQCCKIVIISGGVCTPYTLPLDLPLVGVLFSVISVFLEIAPVCNTKILPTVLFIVLINFIYSPSIIWTPPFYGQFSWSWGYQISCNPYHSNTDTFGSVGTWIHT